MIPYFKRKFILYRFLFDPNCELYQSYRKKVESLRKGFIDESTSRKEDAQKPKDSKRKSRWGDEAEKVNIAQPGVLPVLPGTGSGSGNVIPKRSNPNLIRYAIQVFGTSDLEESQWKQCEDQLKVIMSQIISFRISDKFSVNLSESLLLI